MKKWLVVIGVLLLTMVLVTGAFAGGILVGRLGRNDAVTTPPLPPPTARAEEVEEIVSDENGTTEEVIIENPEASETFNYDLLEDVLDILGEEFYGEIPDGDTLAYGAIRGMLMTLDDPYTSFIEPKIASILKEDATGEFEGIGATVQMREDGYLEIVRPIPGQPAEEAGIQSGDIIVAVNNQSIVGLGLYEAISYIRGPAGTEAVLEVVRPGEPDSIVVSVMRAKIEVPVVEYEILDGDIAYLRLIEFDAHATAKVTEALEELLAQNPEGLIFDLRDNPGGWLDQAIQVTDLFLDEGLVAIKRDSEGGEQRFYSYDGDLGEDISIVVLVNGGSASASEIVAGALRDRDRAILVGETTLGKGSVQLPHDFNDGSQLRVTIARWFTPDDFTIHEAGLEPEIVVPIPPETPVTEDPQLERAIEYLQEGE